MSDIKKKKNKISVLFGGGGGGGGGGHARRTGPGSAFDHCHSVPTIAYTNTLLKIYVSKGGSNLRSKISTASGPRPRFAVT